MKSTVVVGYDRSPSADRALAEAGREAAWRGGAVTVVNAFHWITVTNPVAYIPMDIETSLKTAADEIATAGVDWLRHRYPGLAVDTKTIAGATADAIAEAAREADLLVLGNRGRGGFTGLLLGSVSMRTLEFASCPTMIVRGKPKPATDSIVLALDFADPAGETIGFAFAEASCRKARLDAVSAYEQDWSAADDPDLAKAHALEEVREGLEALLNPWLAKYPDVPVDIDVVDDAAGAVLVDASRGADLVVVGAHRRGDGRPGMRVGPVAHTMLHHADCPVVVVPRA